MAMKLGTIEGVFTGMQVLEELKVKELISDLLNNMHPGTDSMLINQDSLDALPDDLRDIILETTRYVMVYTSEEILMHQQYTYRNAAKEYGIKVWTWSEEEVNRNREKLIAELWPEFASPTPLCNELVEIVKQQLRDLGKL
jgi:TRAP-type C4-dicarboxylate transport system substrate-binding protein